MRLDHNMKSSRSIVSRRDFLRVGSLGLAGLGLGDYLRLAAAGGVTDAKAKSAIVVFLAGGPTQIDTFDMKPDAPAEFRGEFAPIDTNVPGIRVCEHLPRLAMCADKYAVLRVSHTQAAHELATRYLSTGNRPVPSLVYPGYGAVVSKELAGDRELPHFVAIPQTAQSAGYLGVRYAPLATQSTPKPGIPFDVRGIALGDGLTVDAFERSDRLRASLDTALAEASEFSKLAEGLDRFAEQAHDIIASPKAREAFDVSREPASVGERFGEGKFGMSCLLAARLIEAGVRFTTVTYGGWDTHGNNFSQCKDGLLPELDRGLAGLFTTLDERGLLDSTVVLVTGEFGRTPKINDRSGRDHWPRSMFMLMAGGGVRGGQVLGESDEKGLGPVGDPHTPDHVAATFYHALGIDYRQEYHTSTGRPVMLVREGKVIEEVFTG
jgi:uncharacterized protein (DUF1501 family)